MPARGRTGRSGTVGEGLAGGKDRHTLWTPPIQSERTVTKRCWSMGRSSAALQARARRRALDATAWPWARVWEDARGQDLVALSVVVAGVGAAGRPLPGSPGLPPHGPASWQGAWGSDTSSVQRRSAWRPDHTSGTPQTPWPYPSASAARNSRSRRSDTRRRPHNPPRMRRSERRDRKLVLCPHIPIVKGQQTSPVSITTKSRPVP
jgi:hypothetical protein